MPYTFGSAEFRKKLFFSACHHSYNAIIRPNLQRDLRNVGAIPHGPIDHRQHELGVRDGNWTHKRDPSAPIRLEEGRHSGSHTRQLRDCLDFLCKEFYGICGVLWAHNMLVSFVHPGGHTGYVLRMDQH